MEPGGEMTAPPPAGDGGDDGNFNFSCRTQNEARLHSGIFLFFNPFQSKILKITHPQTIFARSSPFGRAKLRGATGS
jgi:hypothetical protein